MARDDFYSNAVIWVKVTLPLVALGLLSTLFLFASAPDPDAALPFADVDLEDITREQRISSPRFAGVLGEGQELVLIAETVSSTGGALDRLNAVGLEGRVELSPTEFWLLDAARGGFDMNAQNATLYDGVQMRSSDGYTLESLSMDMAMNRLDIQSTAPVAIDGPGLTLTAERMEVGGPDGGTIMHFTGSVRMIYDPQNQ